MGFSNGVVGSFSRLAAEVSPYLSLLLLMGYSFTLINQSFSSDFEFYDPDPSPFIRIELFFFWRYFDNGFSCIRRNSEGDSSTETFEPRGLMRFVDYAS